MAQTYPQTLAVTMQGGMDSVPAQGPQEPRYPIWTSSGYDDLNYQMEAYTSRKADTSNLMATPLATQELLWARESYSIRSILLTAHGLLCLLRIS